MSSLDERISKAAEDVQHWWTAKFLAWNPILCDRDHYSCHRLFVY
jgi:hypothetical protein